MSENNNVQVETLKAKTAKATKVAVKEGMPPEMGELLEKAAEMAVKQVADITEIREKVGLQTSHHQLLQTGIEQLQAAMGSALPALTSITTDVKGLSTRLEVVEKATLANSAGISEVKASVAAVAATTGTMSQAIQGWLNPAPLTKEQESAEFWERVWKGAKLTGLVAAGTVAGIGAVEGAKILYEKIQG